MWKRDASSPHLSDAKAILPAPEAAVKQETRNALNPSPGSAWCRDVTPSLGGSAIFSVSSGLAPVSRPSRGGPSKACGRAPGIVPEISLNFLGLLVVGSRAL
jgi:hypothetical protein